MLDATKEWERTHPFADEDLSPDARLYAALKKIEDKIFARPVPSWADVAELAVIALWWSDKEALSSNEDIDALGQFVLGRDPSLQEGDRLERSQAHLTQAAAMLAMQSLGMGGAHA